MTEEQKRIRIEENTYQSGSKTRVEAGNQRSRLLKVEKRGEKVDRQSNIVNQRVKKGEEGETSAKQREKSMKSGKMGPK